MNWFLHLSYESGSVKSSFSYISIFYPMKILLDLNLIFFKL
jgi:hypothetical protein